MIGQLESISCDVCGNPVREDQIHVIPDERTVCRRCYDEYHGRKRPEGCRFWDHRDVVVWIDENTEAIRDWPTAREAAIWWLACAQAKAYRDLNLRELAEMLVNGVKPLTLEDITEELQARHEDASEYSTAAIDDDIEGELRKHFGPKVYKED